MIDELKNLLEQMRRAKTTTVFALLSPIDKEERQNIVWIDSHIGSWMEALEEIIVEVRT